MSDVANAEPSNDAVPVTDHISNDVEAADPPDCAAVAADADVAMKPANVTVAVEHSYSERLSLDVETPPR